MANDSTGRIQGVPSRPAGCGDWAQNTKKILFRRNEAKSLLKIKELAVLGPKNELVLESQSPDQSQEYGQESTLCGAVSETRNWKLESGNWKLQIRAPVSSF